MMGTPQAASVPHLRVVKKDSSLAPQGSMGNMLMKKMELGVKQRVEPVF